MLCVVLGTENRAASMPQMNAALVCGPPSGPAGDGLSWPPAPRPLSPCGPETGPPRVEPPSMADPGFPTGSDLS